ncbi:Ig-like domain-containing protein [Bradyrhizobium cajani]|uniref:Ig-like domain-containing protein n=1 Tax=Bradyrhizobium cajani TaxID=1928661 RepID=UPI00142EDD64
MRPQLVSPDGAQLPAQVVDALTGYTAYAQAGAQSPAGKVVGHIVKISGSASIVRNGVTIVANVGDAINQNDVVQTGSNSTLGLALDDGTTFNLSESARFMLNDLTFDASSTSNSSLMTLVEGAASFVAGQVAKTGDMRVATPTATLGIRGTAVNLSISSSDGTVSISVIDQRDGQVHAVQVFSNTGALIGTVSSNGASLTLTPTATFDVIARQVDKTADQIAQEFNAFQQVLSTYDAAKQIFPNLPQHTENTNPTNNNDANPNSTRFAGSPPLNPPGTEYHPPSTTPKVQTASDAPPPTTVIITTAAAADVVTPTPPLIEPTIVAVKTTSIPFIVTPPNVAAITSGAGNHTGPVMSASGDVVYDPDGTIYFYDRTTGTTTTIASPAGGWSYGSPTISSDGRYIVYEGSDGSGTYVFVYGMDSSDPTHYHVQIQLGQGSSPAVSGDGSTIVVEQGAGNIAIYDLQGNLKGTITAGAVGSAGALWTPAISAGGHIIAFWNSDSSSPGGSGHLYAYDLSTGGLTQIANTASGAGNMPPTVSADGHLIAYQGADGSGHSEIYLYDLNTGAVVFHTGNPSGGSYNPVLSPDGHFIVFSSDARLTSSDQNNFTDIYIVDVTNPAAPVYKLVSEGSGAASHGGVAVSAGGQYVAFGNSNHIFFADPTSGRSVVILETSQSPAILTAAGQITVTGDYSGVGIGVTDQFGHPTSDFKAKFDAAGHINWTFSEAKSDFAWLSYGQDATQTFIITLSANNGTVTIPVFVTVHNGIQPVLNTADFAPIATPVSLAEGQQNTAYTITAADLLHGVIDIDGPLRSITALSLQSGGGTLLQVDGQTWTYTPDAGFSGQVIFSYTTSDSIKSASSTASLNIALPLAITAISPDSGVAGDFITSNTNLVVSGTNGSLTSGEKIQLSNDNGVTWTDVVQDTATSWSFADPLTHAVGFTYRVRVVDSNDTPINATSQAVVIDTAPPVLSITSASGFTNQVSLTLTGTLDLADVGAIVTVFDDGQSIGTATVQADGSWTKVVSLHAGANNLSSQAADVAGNLGTSNTIVVTLDTTAPSETLAITAISSDTGTAGDFITSDTTLTVSGSNGALASDEKIQVSSNGGVTWVDVTQSTATTWSYLDPATHAASFTYQVRIVDLAGNIGTTASQAITIDTTAPAEALAITAISSDTGTGGDFITSDTILTVSGTNGALAAGEKIQVSSDGGTTWADVTQSTSTTWSYADPATHAASFTYQARIVDLSGNIGTATSHAVTVDTTAPAEALAITAISSDTATPGDFITSDTTLTVSGSNGALAAGEKIQVSGDGGVTWADVTQLTATTWSYVDPATHVASFTYQARIVDLAGNIGTTASQAITIDTGAPAEALAIAAISSDTGTAGDFITSDTTLTVSGSNGALAPDEKIQVSNNGGVTWADVTQSTATTWSHIDPTTHAASFTYQVRIVDLAGNIGTTASQAVTIDTTAPSEALAITAISSDTGTAGDFVTSDTSLTVSGTNGVLAAGERIQVSSDGGTTWVDVTQSTSTTWSYADPATHATSFTYQARIVDLAGNIGTATSHAVTIDTTAPAEALAITAISSDTGTAGDFITSDTTLTVSGTNGALAASEKIQVSSDGGVTWADVTQSTVTSWSHVDPATHAASFTYQARIVDLAGNIGTTASQAITIDTGAPAEALAITAISSDTGTAGDFITSDTTLTVSGSNGALAPDEKIQVSSNGGVTWVDVTQSTATTWSHIDPATHAASFTYQVRIVDLAGNIGTTASQAVTIDTTAPSEALAITAISADTGTAGDFVTSDTSLTVSGTNGALAPGERIQVSSDGGVTWADVTQSTATTWSHADPATHAASFTYQARIVDLSGNIGTATSHAVTIDTGAPAEALAITAISSDTGTAGDFVTSDTTLTVSGTNGALAASEKIQVSSDGGVTWADVTQSTATSWSHVDPATHAASFTYQARIVDLAGNIGTTASQAITIDTGAPTEALAIAAISSDTGTAGDFITSDTTLTVSGSNGALAAGDKIQVSSDGGTTWVDVTQSTATTWSYLDPATHAASFTYQARIVNLAGNIGTTTSHAVTIDTTAPGETLAITAISSDTGTGGDFVTSDTSLTVSGTNGVLAAGERIQVSSDGGTTWADVTQSTSTTWSYVDPTTHATSFTYQARIIDLAGNIGTTTSHAVTIDTTAPAEALAITAIGSDTGTAGDFITSDTTLTVSGTNGALAAGEKIQISSDGGTTWIDVTQSTSTTWSYADPATHSASFSYQVRIVDLGGNIGTTVSQAITIDTTAPAETLAITAIDQDTGTPGDFVTNDPTLTVSGTNGVLAFGEKIQVSSDGGVTWADATQSTSTTWSYVDPVTHASSFTYQARIVDAAGNIGTTASHAVTIDTSAPTESLAIGSVAGSSSPTSTAITISGTNSVLQAGDKVQISTDGTTWTDVARNSLTRWSFVDTTVRTANFTYFTRVVDSTGNVGATANQPVVVAGNGGTATIAGASSVLAEFTGSGGTLQIGPAGLTGTINAISIASGSVTINGTGTVTATTGDAIDLYATGATSANPANLTVNPTGQVTGAASGISVLQNAYGSITVTASGPVTGQSGKGIWAQQSATGTGSILINGSGSVTGSGAAFSGIVATILNASNNNNITVNESGDITGGYDGIRVVTNGNGNEIITTGANATVTGLTHYGIEAQSGGTGNISITTGSTGTITAASAAINAYNQASAIPKVGGVIASSISVTANGTINSGTVLTGNGSLPAGILAGYKGGANNTVNSSVYGNVNIDNYANVNAAAGDGIRGYNFGSGNVTINHHAGAITAKNEYGIAASSYGSGNVSITTSTGTSIASGSHGIMAINLATAIAGSALSSVSVTASGTITSGTHLSSGGSQPQGISVGYFGSNGTSNSNINGTVTLDNSANVTALAGWGLLAYNWGNGNVTLIDRANTVVSGAQIGIAASSNVSGPTATPSTVTLTVEANATITSGALYGLAGIQSNNASGGSIFITTASGDVITSGGTGINANAVASSASSGTQVSVTAAGTINSGYNFFSNGSGPSGIAAGFGSSNGQVNSAVQGNVVVNTSASVTAASGWGLNLYNFGTGNISATVQAGAVIKAPLVGINAFAQGGGSVTIINNGAITSSGVAINTGTGTGASSVNGTMSVTNTGTIVGSGSVFNQVVQINSSNSTQAATFTNAGTVTASLFGKTTNSYALAMYSVSGTVTALNNGGGVLTGNVSLGGAASFTNAAGAIWSLNGQNSIGSSGGLVANAGIMNVLGFAILSSGGSLALANTGSINLAPNSAARIFGNVSGNGTILIGDRSELEISGTVTGQTVSFATTGRGLLTIDLPSSFSATIDHFSIGNVIALTGAGISSATLGSGTISVTGASQSYSYNVTNVQSGAMLDILAADKLMLLSASTVQLSDNLQYFISSPALSYVLDHDTISGSGSGFVVSTTDASIANTYSVVVNQTSSINVTGAGVGVAVSTGGANIAIVNAGTVSSGGTGISSSSGGGAADISDYGNVSGTQYAIAATSSSGKLNILTGIGASLTSANSYGLYAQTTSGDINITTLFGTINSGSAGILAQEQGSAGASGSITVINESTITSGAFSINSGAATVGPANGSAGIRAGILNNGTTSFNGSTTTGNVYVEDRGNITAATGSGIFAFNYGAGNTTVSLGQGAQIQATAAGSPTSSGFTQYGIFAFNYGAGSSTVTTGWGSTINSGGTAINAGNQATTIAQGSGSTVTVIAQGIITSGVNNNNSGSAPSAIQAGYNPGNAGVSNPNTNNVYGDVFVGVSGDGSTNGFITAAAGSGINAYNYGVGSVTVTLGPRVSIQALTAATSSTSGNAPYGIGILTLGPGNITVTTGSQDNIQSGSTGINAVNEATSIAAAVGATIAVTTAGVIHSRTLLNNGGNQPSGISAGFLGGLTQTPNLNVNGAVIINNAATITADAGIGINAYNFGNGNIAVNQASGANITAVQQAISAHAEGAGTGDIAVNVYANSTLTSAASYGIMALNTNNGSISVITSAGDVINSGGAGINAAQEATATSASTSVVVTAAGTINSGTALTGFGNQPAGIIAGYIGQATNPAPGNAANYNVHGEVVVNNFATITAAAGNGIQAYNYGTGDVYANNFGATITALGGASPPNGSGVGILAQTYGPGSVYVTTTGATFINSGSSGIAALNKATTADPGNPTVVVPATSVISVIANGTIHSGTIPTANAAGDPAAGILASYNPNNQSTVDSRVLGSIFVDDHATIVAPTGTDGIRAANYGTGNISIVVESDADIIAGRYGVAGLGYDGGDVSIVIAGSVIGGTAGIDAITTGSGIVTIDNSGFVSGVITAYNGTVTNQAGADWQLNGASVFTGTSTLSNAGTIESTGVSSIQGLAGLTNTGTIAVESGSLTIGSSVTGGGTAIVHNASLVLSGASDMLVSFNTGPTTPGVLVLGDVTHFTGTVTGFTYGDTIDLVGIAPGSVSVSNSGGLTVNYGTGAFALVGDYDPTGFSIASDGQGGTNIVWNHQAPVIVTSQFGTVHNPDGSTTITGLLVTDSDPNAGTETFSLAATTQAASSGSSVSVSTSSGSLSAINGIFASGVTYLPGATPPATDMVSLTVKDGFGATQTVNFVFNQAGIGPNITLQGTAGNDVIFATNSADTLAGGTGLDQFVFAPASASPIMHTISDFTVGIDKLDVRQFSGLSASSLPSEVQVGNDTLLSLGANDSILLKNIVATSLHATDFIFHA